VRKKEGVDEELVDVLFMVISLANLFGVDLEKGLTEKYLKGDPRSRWDLPSL
jgi:NTP pyrophosphatase (non-canonical NTP hydrolase)